MWQRGQAVTLLDEHGMAMAGARVWKLSGPWRRTFPAQVKRAWLVCFDGWRGLPYPYLVDVKRLARADSAGMAELPGWAR